MKKLSLPARALAGGTVCLAILAGMVVGHAWPLWTGRDVVLVATIDPAPQRSVPGEFVGLSTPADRLQIADTIPLGPDANEWEKREADAAARETWTRVRTIGPWPPANASDGFSASRELRGRAVYVQLEPGPSGDYVPVSVSLRAVEGALNLRGLFLRGSRGLIRVQYGLDAFYLPGERAAATRAGAAGKRVQMRVAIARSGRARIRDLVVDGVPVQ